jgi:hypothetical protein
MLAAMEGTFPPLTQRMMSIDRLFRHAVRQAVDQSNRALSAWALNHMHLHALVALAAAPGGALSVGELGDAIGEDLDRARGTVDRRTVVIRLTDRGATTLEEVVPSFSQLLSRQLQVLENDDLSALENMLERLLSHLGQLRL